MPGSVANVLVWLTGRTGCIITADNSGNTPASLDFNVDHTIQPRSALMTQLVQNPNARMEYLSGTNTGTKSYRYTDI